MSHEETNFLARLLSGPEDAEHEVIPSPVGALADRAKMRAYYQTSTEQGKWSVVFSQGKEVALSN
jgi:hypothetical protein